MNFDWIEILRTLGSILGGGILLKLMESWLGKKRESADVDHTNAETEIMTFDTLKEGFEALKNQLFEINKDILDRLDKAEIKHVVLQKALNETEHELIKTKMLVTEQSIKIQSYENKIREYENLMRTQVARIEELKHELAIARAV